MKPVHALVPILLAVGFVGCKLSANRTDVASGGTGAIDAKAQDIADLKTLEDRFNAAFRAKDVNAIMQMCVPGDSLVVFDVHPPLEFDGAQAYRKDWEDTFSRFNGPLEADIRDLDVEAGTDVAYARYIHHVSGTTKGGQPRDYAVRVTDCFKKIKGKWLITHSHVSVPMDLQTGKADIESKP